MLMYKIFIKLIGTYAWRQHFDINTELILIILFSRLKKDSKTK